MQSSLCENVVFDILTASSLNSFAMHLLTLTAQVWCENAIETNCLFTQLQLHRRLAISREEWAQFSAEKQVDDCQSNVRHQYGDSAGRASQKHCITVSWLKQHIVPE